MGMGDEEYSLWLAERDAEENASDQQKREELIRIIRNGAHNPNHQRSVSRAFTAIADLLEMIR